MNKSTGTTTTTIFISYYNKITAERTSSGDNFHYDDHQLGEQSWNIR